MDAAPLKDQEIEYKRTGFRWVILILFSGCMYANDMMILTLTPVALQIQEGFGVAAVWINMCALVFAITSLPMNFVSIWAYKKFPNHWVIKIGAALLLIGSMIRYMSITTGSFYWTVFGLAVASLGTPLICNGVNVIAIAWFGDDERASAVTIHSIVQYCGDLSSFALTGFVFLGYENETNL